MRSWNELKYGTIMNGNYAQVCDRNATIINKMELKWLNLCLTMKCSWNNRKIGSYRNCFEIHDLRTFWGVTTKGYKYDLSISSIKFNYGISKVLK